MKMGGVPSPARRCPLCGGSVPDSRDHCASGCPFGKHCRILCCPSCGYEFVEESVLVNGIRRLTRLRWRKSA